MSEGTNASWGWVGGSLLLEEQLQKPGHESEASPETPRGWQSSRVSSLLLTAPLLPYCLFLARSLYRQPSCEPGWDGIQPPPQH